MTMSIRQQSPISDDELTQRLATLRLDLDRADVRPPDFVPVQRRRRGASRIATAVALMAAAGLTLVQGEQILVAHRRAGPLSDTIVVSSPGASRSRATNAKSPTTLPGGVAGVSVTVASRVDGPLTRMTFVLKASNGRPTPVQVNAAWAPCEIISTTVSSVSNSALGSKVEVRSTPSMTANVSETITIDGWQNIVTLVMDQQKDWLRVGLPGGSKAAYGWVRTSDFHTFTNAYSLVYESGKQRLTTCKDGEPIRHDATTLEAPRGTSPGVGLVYLGGLVRRSPQDTPMFLTKSWSSSFVDSVDLLDPTEKGPGIRLPSGAVLHMSRAPMNALIDTVPLGTPLTIVK
jgi:hypothetical protein